MVITANEATKNRKVSSTVPLFTWRIILYLNNEYVTVELC